MYGHSLCLRWCHFVSEFCKHVLLLTHCSSPLTLLHLFTFITIAVLGQRCKLWRFSLRKFSSLFSFCFSQLQHAQCCCSWVHDSLMVVHAPVNCTAFYGSLIIYLIISPTQSSILFFPHPKKYFISAALILPLSFSCPRRNHKINVWWGTQIVYFLMLQVFVCGFSDFMF